MSRRRATHAGSWYSNDRAELAAELAGYLDAALVTCGKARAVIAPHAGYSYSGPTAAWAFKHIDRTGIRRVFLLGPSHHVYSPRCSLTTCTEYSTPLGPIQIDVAMNATLRETGLFDDVSAASSNPSSVGDQSRPSPCLSTSQMPRKTDETEHSMELECPFIYQVCERCRPSRPGIRHVFGSSHELFLPRFNALFFRAAYTGDGGPELPARALSRRCSLRGQRGRVWQALRRGARHLPTRGASRPGGHSTTDPWPHRLCQTALALMPRSQHLANPENLFVISSDFCHWGKRFRFTPFAERGRDIYKSIEQLDRQGMALIEAQDAEGFARYQREYGNTICGQHPIAVLLHALQARARALSPLTPPPPPPPPLSALLLPPLPLPTSLTLTVGTVGVHLGDPQATVRPVRHVGQMRRL